MVWDFWGVAKSQGLHPLPFELEIYDFGGAQTFKPFYGQFR